MEERDYYLGFSLCSGIGPKRFAQLLRIFKTARQAWEASETDLKNAKIGEGFVRKLIDFRNKFDFTAYSKLLKQKKASFVAKCDKEYPKLLKQIPNPPIVIFVRGDVGSVDFEKTIGVVGTRKITNYGREVTKLFASDLALSGFTVVSGLAMGVDAEAAWAAINSNGKTIAVLGNGVDLCFPSSNENLYDKILDGNGCIISEFPLGQTPTPGSFPSRNRIIAGLSLGVLVTEGALDSGSLITADYAFKFQRKVFAVPGPITSQLSVAPLKLIEKGAKLVTGAEDICRELKIQNLKGKITSQNLKFQNISKEESMIIKLLENEGLSFDELARSSKIEPSGLGALLSMMEIKGLIKNNGSGGYVIG